MRTLRWVWKLLMSLVVKDPFEQSYREAERTEDERRGN